MNLFALGAAALYVGASIWSWRHGHTAMAYMWFFYAAANVALTVAEYQRGGA